MHRRRWLATALIASGAMVAWGLPASAAAPRTSSPPRGQLSSGAIPTSGAPISCVDARSGAPFVFHALHLFGGGEVDPDWRPDSSRLCVGSVEGLRQNVLADGAGGAFVGWVDGRAGDADIYLQRFVSTGAVAPEWPAGGLPVCRAALSQYGLDLAGDGAGGVFLVWEDFRQGRAGDIYAQHVTASGVPVPGWPEGGRAVCTDPAEQSSPRLAADGSGGIYVVWQDRRGGTLDLFAQHLGADGALVPGWPTDGAELAGGPGHEVAPGFYGDSLGHATVVWRSEGGSSGTSLEAAALLPSTTPAAGWPPAPITLAQSADEISDPVVVSGGEDASLIVWSQRQGGQATLRAQRLTGSLTVAPGWPAEGLVLCASAVGRNAPAVLADGAGGAMVAWEDFRSDGSSHIYAQRIVASGERAPGWDANGMAVCTSAGFQYAPALAADGSGGAIVTWADDASSALAGYVSVAPANPAGRLRLVEATARPAHAHIVWRFETGIATKLLVYRREVNADWQLIGTVTPDDSGRVVVDDRQAPEGQSVQYRLTWVGEDLVVSFEPVTLQIPRAPDRLALHRAWLTASHNTIAVSLALPRGPAAALELLDVTGRRVASLSLAGLEPGEQTVPFSTPGRLASGVYFMRLQQGAQARVAKFVVVR